MSDKTRKIDSPTAVIGALAMQFQAKYGDEALEIFKPILREYGRHAGSRLARKLADKAFPERVEAWLEPLTRQGLSEVELTEDPSRVTIRGTDCPLNLEGSNKAVCDACMAIDEGLVSALAGHEVTMHIAQSMARGDARCVVHFDRTEA